MTAELGAPVIARICGIYQEEILGMRHRVVTLAGRRCRPLLMRTLLGFELQLGRKRVTCPDLVTAQYLSLFAEIGMPQVSIPYDLTITSALMPALEAAFQELRVLRASTPGVYGKLRGRLIRLQGNRPESTPGH